MRKQLISFILIPLIFSGCGNEDTPQPQEANLTGYWALSHIEIVNHDEGLHATTSKDIPLHINLDDIEEKVLWDVLIFDGNFATVRGDMPNRPKEYDYDLYTPDGQIAFINAWHEWHDKVGSSTDQYACPVGTYSIKGSDLIIGSLNMGRIVFLQDDAFSLEYKKIFDSKDKYRLSTYTYKRIYSLTM